MLLYARKKFLRDDRILQLVLLLSILRGDPGSVLLGPENSSLQHLPHDLILGSSLGHARPSSPLSFSADLHPKNLDRILADYQRSVLEDLNALGSYSSAQRPREEIIHTYLLNTHSNMGSPTTGDTADHPPSEPPPEPNLNNDLTPEDLALIDALFKQDVDMGIPRDLFEDDGDHDLQTKEKDHNKKPKSGSEVEKSDDNSWMQFNFTVDSETGEQLLDSPISGGNVTLDPGSPLTSTFPLTEPESDLNLEFNLDEALKLVGLNCSETGETVWKATETVDSEKNNAESKKKEDEDSENSLDFLDHQLEEMIQASQLHTQHPRSLQG